MKLRDVVVDIDNFKIAYVKWADATHNDGWYGSVDEFDLEPMEMGSVGWLVYRDEKSISIATSAGTYKLGDILVIPMGCVIDVQILQPPNVTDRKRGL